jgi:hypothetical protein
LHRISTGFEQVLIGQFLSVCSALAERVNSLATDFVELSSDYFRQLVSSDLALGKARDDFPGGALGAFLNLLAAALSDTAH